GDLKFDPILHKGYKEIQKLEPDLVQAQQDITWAEHVVWVYPTWWASFPALLKGFFDRIILPGFAFHFHKENPFWDRLLKGRTSDIVVTMDGPKWLYYILFGAPGVKVVKRGILDFCGVKVKKVITIGDVKKLDEQKKKKWIGRVYRRGKSI
ncbi:MAG: NAD(P)H-dependent oxidoreductase, partial [Candidatus Magasanikbacteria bacterium]